MARAGAVLGLAGAAFAALGLAFAHRARAQGADRARKPAPPSPLPRPAPAAYPSGVPMADQAYDEAFWRPTIHRLIATEFPRVSEAFAVKWGEIESGWNPAAVGDPGQLGQGSSEPAEIGLGQLYNPDDFVHLHAPSPSSFRAYTPAASQIVPQYRQAQADAAAAIKAGDTQAHTAAIARMAALARQIQSRTRALTPDEVDAQVRWTLLAKIADDMAIADKVVATYSLAHWPVPDYWKLVKAPHALPGILNQGMPAVVKKLGRAPVSWTEFRTVLGMEGNSQWRRALDACETCGDAVTATPQAVS